MNRDEYMQEIVVKVVEELSKLNEDDSMDLITLLKNHVSLQIVPMDNAYSADEAVPEDEKEMLALQKELLDQVLKELKKQREPHLLH